MVLIAEFHCICQIKMKVFWDFCCYCFVVVVLFCFVFYSVLYIGLNTGCCLRKKIMKISLTEIRILLTIVDC